MHMTWLYHYGAYDDLAYYDKKAKLAAEKTP